MLFSKPTLATGETFPRHMGDRWSVTMATAHAGYPASNLLTGNLGRYALAWNHRASGTWVHAASDTSTEARVIGTVALLGVNRLDPTVPNPGLPVLNRWRVRIDQYPLADRVRPGIASISSLVNLTGAATDISGPLDPPVPFAPDGYAPTKLEAVDPALNTSFRATFDNHHATERALTGQQYLRVLAADSADPATVITVGRVGATIVPSSGSSFALTPSSIEVTDEGCIVNFPWTASQLTVPSATVRVDIVGQTAGGTTVEFPGVEWLAELSGVEYDSGLLDANATSVRVNPGHAIPANVPRYVLVTLSDFGTVNPMGFDEFEFIPNTSGPLQVGRFLAVETFEVPTTNDGWTYAPESNGGAVDMRDGSQRFPATVLSRDVYEIRSEGRSEEQAINELLLGLFRAVDVVHPFLVMPFPENPKHDRWVHFAPDSFRLSGGGVKARADGTGPTWSFEASVREYSARAAGRG